MAPETTTVAQPESRPVKVPKPRKDGSALGNAWPIILLGLGILLTVAWTGALAAGALLLILD